MLMNENSIARFEPEEHLEALLEERGITTPEGSTALFKEFGIIVGVKNIYGIETALPEGGIGRLIVRGVEQLPEPYITQLPPDHERSIEFYERRMSGLLIDASISSVSLGHFIVARRSVLQMKNAAGNGHMKAHASKQLSIGARISGPTSQLLDFQITNPEVSRVLGVAEMDYSEPNAANMIISVFQRRK